MPYGTNSALSLSLALVGSEIFGQPNLEGSTVVTFNHGWNDFDLAASYLPTSHPLASAGIFDLSASHLMRSAVFIPESSSVDQGFSELRSLTNSELAEAKYTELLVQNAPTQIQKVKAKSKKVAKEITEKVGEKIAAAASPITAPVKEVVENISYVKNQVNKISKAANVVSTVFNNSCFLASIAFCAFTAPVFTSFAAISIASAYMFASENANLQKVILAASPLLMLGSAFAAGIPSLILESSALARTAFAAGSFVTTCSAYSMFTNKGQARFAGVIEAITGNKSCSDWINGKVSYPLALAALAFGKNFTDHLNLGDRVSNLARTQLENWVINIGNNIESRISSCFSMISNPVAFISNIKEAAQDIIGKSEPSVDKMVSSFVSI